MAINPLAYTEKVIRSFLRYQLTTYPFADDRLDDLCRLIDELGLLAPGGRVYLEQDRAKPGITLPEHWRLLKDKTAGNVRYMLAGAAG